MKALIAEEKRIAERFRCLRVLAGLDSQVCLGSLVKGRASSKAINNLLRQSMPYSISSDIQLHYMYYNTKHNRSDGPTRNKDPAPPDMEQPLWVNDLQHGKTESFDVWMRIHCRDLVQHEVPFNEIGGPVEVDIRSARATRGSNYFNSRGGPQHSGVEPRRDCCSGVLGPDGKVDVKMADAVPSTSSGSKRPGDWRQRSLLCKEAITILESFSEKQFFFSGAAGEFLAPGGIDLFSGRKGVARQMIAFGAPWVMTIDYDHGPGQDLLDPILRQKIVRLIELGGVMSLGAAPICSSFSVAVTPPVRSSKHPRGIKGLRPSMRKKVSEGNSHNDYMADLLALCEQRRVAYWVENRDTSWWWRQRRWRKFRSTLSKGVFRCCFCRFGTGWKKPTRVATNTALGGMTMWCTCSSRHTLLRGTHPTKRIPWTLVAQPYPRGFSRMLAAALCAEVGWCAAGKLDISGCARTGTMRIGEAAHPGPRRHVPRDGTLENMPLQRAQTLAMEARLLEAFLQWCNSFFVDGGASSIFDTVPQFLASALRCYGDLQYQNGGALSNLRHLLLAAQRWKPGVKPFMSMPWEIVERWEAISPVKHRSPVPEVVVGSGFRL